MYEADKDINCSPWAKELLQLEKLYYKLDGLFLSGAASFWIMRKAVEEHELDEIRNAASIAEDPIIFLMDYIKRRVLSDIDFDQIASAVLDLLNEDNRSALN